jgi:hypothetical protein
MADCRLPVVSGETKSASFSPVNSPVDFTGTRNRQSAIGNHQSAIISS